MISSVLSYLLLLLGIVCLATAFYVNRLLKYIRYIEDKRDSLECEYQNIVHTHKDIYSKNQAFMHDIANPLQRLLRILENANNTKFMKSGEDIGLAEIRNIITTLYGELNDVTQIIHLTRRSMVPVKKEPLNLNKEIDNILARKTSELRGGNVDLKWSSPRETIYVLVDKIDLAHILVGLISNAVKYFDKKNKELKISLTHDLGKREATLMFRDNGCGMNKYEINSLGKIKDNATLDESDISLGLGIKAMLERATENGINIYWNSIKGEWTEVSVKFEDVTVEHME